MSAEQDKRPWLELAARVHLEQDGRDLARALRRAGALRLWCPPGWVRAVFTDTPATRASLASLPALAASPQHDLIPFYSPDPLARWQAPQLNQVHPRLALAPAWSGLAPGPNLLLIDPLTAFGAGDHPSTSLNLSLLADALERLALPPGTWAADVGAGSGVLALALALLGGLCVLAIDPDPAAARATARNQALNPGPGAGVFFVRGAHACLAGSFPLLAANLPGPLLLHVAPHLASCLSAGASLVVSGFRAEFAPGLLEAMASLGLRPRQQARQGDWLGLWLEKE